MKTNQSSPAAGLLCRKVGILLIVSILMSMIVACAPEEAELPEGQIAPSTEQQIINLVEDYYMGEQNVLNEGEVPAYEASVDEIDGEWARVSIRPVGVESDQGPDIVFLQNTADLVARPTEEAVSGEAAGLERSDIVGWTIVAGPQVQFTDEELDAAGVPVDIRS